MTTPPRSCHSSEIESLERLVLLSAGPLTEGTADADVLIAGEDGEQLHGGDGNDTLIALVGNNHLFGGDGDDELVSARTDNLLNGGSGRDTAVYWASQSEFTVVVRTDGSVQVSNGQRTDSLTGIEFIRFDDATIAVADLPEPEFRSIDGTGNHLQNPELGSTDERLLRYSPAAYADGLNEPAGDDRPSARLVSNEIVSQTGDLPNSRGLTDLTWLWGQFLDHDIDLTEPGEPHERYAIKVPTGDRYFDPHGTGQVEIELSRSVYDPDTGIDSPRQQINQITAYIDGSMVYGADDERADALRAFEGGRLKISDGDLLPYNTDGLPNAGGDDARLFLAGDIRANENAALTSMHTLWVREHNRLADQISMDNPELSDEQIYQRARTIVIAEIQAITFNEFLPAILGDDAIEEYSGYDSAVNPGIANEFSTAAYRFGHTMLTGQLLRLDENGEPIESGHLPLRQAFFAPHQVAQHGIDSLLRGTASKAANEIDPLVVDDVRNFLFGPPGAGGFDLPSLNIQRGRDHGLADYNTVRTSLGLTAAEDFADITSDPALQQKLEQVYGSVDNIDLWIGGLSEDHVSGASMGETFRTILADQFRRLRDGDRFWYEHALAGETLELVEATTLSDVIERNTGVDNLQDNVFFLPSAGTV